MNALTPTKAAAAETPHGLLRFLTCGSVDDGKSTLIGRLLYDTKAILEDQMTALEKDSRRHGTTGEAVDLALLVDGLEAEREQGITIDVAYRFFATPRRSFIVADTPGHEQYTRNMATGASNSDLAVLLVDARKGLLTQTRRHAVIASLLGIRHVVLAVNKIDLVGFDEATFRAIVADFEAFAEPLGFRTIEAIPLSARFGDNVTEPSASMPWHDGPTLLGHLERVEVEADRTVQPFRMPVQLGNRPNLDFRGFSGTVASGRVAVGEEVVIASSGHTSRVARIVTFDGDRAEAAAGDAVTIVLADEVDAPRGEVLAAPKARPAHTTRFRARLVWMAAEPLKPGRGFLLKTGARTVPATVSQLAAALDVETYADRAADELPLNGIGLVEVETGAPVSLDPYADNRETGAFILIDRFANTTVAAGMVTETLGGGNVYRHGFDVDRASRAGLKHQRPVLLWFTGLPGSGKSTIANLVERRLAAIGRHTMLIDGDALRIGLNTDLGFDAASRAENIRRAGEVASLMLEAGLVVLCAFVSPFRADRERLRERIGADFVEVFVDTPVEICAERDPKGLYARAKAGGIKDFTGIGQDYEAPLAADLVLHAGEGSPEQLAGQVLTFVEPLIAGDRPTSEDSAAL
ncbi:sulfate adenylyltransferase subunit CysN [Chelatococcus reniformis]|uniref:Multifunctional fusion protein n=1 Tax=Chelatococcus reniformis TaxID=1494448 RepID=A0A916U7T5_9HYPH|nr:sulfate adenylyltransferase subunit CysN [Chelatococcus reniformis]GGC62995.1 adenylyl-sulfate kinase [Chelatococcus reniformis]